MITQFTVGASRTTNLGNFESLRVEASVTVEVQDQTDSGVRPLRPLDVPADLRGEAQKVLRQLMEDTYNEFKVKKEKK